MTVSTTMGMESLHGGIDDEDVNHDNDKPDESTVDKGYRT